MGRSFVFCLFMSSRCSFVFTYEGTYDNDRRDACGGKSRVSVVIVVDFAHGGGEGRKWEGGGVMGKAFSLCL